MHIIFKRKERELLKKILQESDDEIELWQLPNVIIPIAVVVISIICYIVFKPAENVTFIAILNLLVNGSLPMFALNRVTPISLNLFKYNKVEESKKKTNTYNIRVKIDTFSKLLIAVILIYYVYQVINIPFNNTWAIIIIHTPFTTFLLWISISLSKYSFLLQEHLVNRTIADDVSDGTNEGKKHLNEKYG